jgi:hypothetical protein
MTAARETQQTYFHGKTKVWGGERSYSQTCFKRDLKREPKKEIPNEIPKPLDRQTQAYFYIFTILTFICKDLLQFFSVIGGRVTLWMFPPLFWGGHFKKQNAPIRRHSILWNALLFFSSPFFDSQ